LPPPYRASAAERSENRREAVGPLPAPDDRFVALPPNRFLSKGSSKLQLKNTRKIRKNQKTKPGERFFAVLETPPIKSALDAVRATIVADKKKQGTR